MSGFTPHIPEHLQKDTALVDKGGIDIISPDRLTQLILDPSVLYSSKTDIDLIELYSRELIPSLHRTRNENFCPSGKIQQSRGFFLKSLPSQFQQTTEKQKANQTAN